MSSEIQIVARTSVVPGTCQQTQSDEQLIELWLHGLSPHTQRAYRADCGDFRRVVSVPLRDVGLADVQAFAAYLETLRLVDGSRRRKLAALKSLFAFGHRIGYLPFDVARPLRIRAARDPLNERILDEGEVHSMLAQEANPRNRAMLALLYVTGVRVSELVALRWRDCQTRTDGGQITVLGKGRRTRTVLLPGKPWNALMALRGIAGADQPVFRSRRGGELDPTAVWRVVRAAAQRAGIQRPVSPHWLRHGHASHALDRGAPIHLVQATLGHASVATTGRYLHARPTDSSSRYLPL